MTLPGQAGLDIKKIMIIMNIAKFESIMFDTCIDLALLSAGSVVAFSIYKPFYFFKVQ